MNAKHDNRKRGSQDGTVVTFEEGRYRRVQPVGAEGEQIERSERFLDAQRIECLSAASRGNER